MKWKVFLVYLGAQCLSGSFSSLCVSDSHTRAPFCVFPQLGRYTKDGQLFLGPLGSTGEDTRCIIDDQISSIPQLINCDRVTNVKQMTWHFSQVRTFSHPKKKQTKHFSLTAREGIDMPALHLSPCSAERVHRKSGHGSMSGGGAG